MKTLNAKLILSALGIAAMLSSPALAQTVNRHPSQTMQNQAPVAQYSSRGDGGQNASGFGDGGSGSGSGYVGPSAD